MSEHKVTEFVLNAGLQRSALVSCVCGLKIEVADIRKLSLSVARKQLEGMHKNLKPKKDRKITTNPVLTPNELRDLNKPKKEKAKKPVVEPAPEIDEWIGDDYPIETKEEQSND